MSYIFIIFLSFSFLSFSQVENQKDHAEARVFLKKVLSKYQNKNIYFKIRKEFSLPVINTIIKERGSFFISDNKFKIAMKGESNYLMVFDGQYLWYQADLKEKIVFKLKDHPDIYLLFSLFNSEQFFKYFKIEKAVKKGARLYHFELSSKGQISDLKSMSLIVGSYIQESKMIWNDLDQWQKYKFLNPWEKKYFSKSTFEFQSQGFEVISKKDL